MLDWLLVVFAKLVFCLVVFAVSSFILRWLEVFLWGHVSLSVALFAAILLFIPRRWRDPATRR